jgi:hypothetical protein
MVADSDRRKTLKLAYRLAFPVMGVFAIRNLGNGRLFVDQSSNLTGALNRHRSELRFGTHRNRDLQQDWINHGEAQFSFEILEQVAERKEADFDYIAECERRLTVWRQRFLDGTSAAYN